MMKKIFLLLFIALFFPYRLVFAEEIRDFAATYRLNTDGTVDISEQITYDFGTEERHGIFRTIPTIKTNEEGKKFVLEFDDIAVVDEKGQSYRFSESREDGELELRIGDPDRTISGVHIYRIRYNVSGAITYFSDHDELYWNITGNDWNVPIVQSSAEIVFPAAVSASDLQASCFTGASGSTENRCSAKTGDGNITVSAQNLNSYEGLTIVAGFPIDLVAHLEPKPYVTFFETILGKIVLGIIVIAAILWYIVYPISIPIRWWKYGRDPKPPMGVASAWFEPPKSKTGRLLTPAESGVLVDERADMEDVTATIVDLARRGHLNIIEVDKKSFGLEKQKTPKDEMPLQEFEQKLFNSLFKSGEYLKLKGADLASDIESVKAKLYDGAVAEGFFPKNPESIRTMYAVISVLGLMTGNFQLMLSALIFGRAMPRKTMVGAQTAAIAKSLRNFITSQDRQFKFQAEHKLLFEKLLPYAVAFGVEKIWAKRFAHLNLPAPSWYVGSATGRFNSAHFISSLDGSLNSFRSAATPTRSSSGFSSGFSGGSSGGGGGGGGGGSW